MIDWSFVATYETSWDNYNSKDVLERADIQNDLIKHSYLRINTRATYSWKYPIRSERFCVVNSSVRLSPLFNFFQGRVTRLYYEYIILHSTRFYASSTQSCNRELSRVTFISSHRHRLNILISSLSLKKTRNVTYHVPHLRSSFLSITKVWLLIRSIHSWNFKKPRRCR